MHSVDLLSQLVQLGLIDGLGGLLPFGFQPKVRECGHYNLLLSSTRKTLYGCAVNNQKQILED